MHRSLCPLLTPDHSRQQIVSTGSHIHAQHQHQGQGQDTEQNRTAYTQDRPHTIQHSITSHSTSQRPSRRVQPQPCKVDPIPRRGAAIEQQCSQPADRRREEQDSDSTTTAGTLRDWQSETTIAIQDHRPWTLASQPGPADADFPDHRRRSYRG